MVKQGDRNALNLYGVERVCLFVNLYAILRVHLAQ